MASHGPIVSLGGSLGGTSRGNKSPLAVRGFLHRLKLRSRAQTAWTSGAEKWRNRTKDIFKISSRTTPDVNFPESRYRKFPSEAPHFKYRIPLHGQRIRIFRLDPWFHKTQGPFIGAYTFSIGQVYPNIRLDLLSRAFGSLS